MNFLRGQTEYENQIILLSATHLRFLLKGCFFKHKTPTADAA